MDPEQNVRSASHEHPIYIGYIVIGGFLTVVNCVILFAIIGTREIRARKEFVLIAGLCIVDLLVGLGFLLAAIYRLSLWEDFPSLVPRSDCKYHAFHHLIVIGYPLVGAMCVVQAADRLFAIRAPILYSQWTTTYAFAMVSVPILLSMTGTIVNVYLNWNSQELIDAFCYTSAALHPLYGQITSVLRMGCCLIAILLYANFYLRLRTHFRSLSTALQSRITVTIGLTTLNAFVFMFIPDLFILSNVGELRTRFGLVFYIAVLVKLFLDFTILFCRHDELRRAMKKILLPWTERALQPFRHSSQQRAVKTHSEELASLDEQNLESASSDEVFL